MTTKQHKIAFWVFFIVGILICAAGPLKLGLAVMLATALYLDCYLMPKD